MSAAAEVVAPCLTGGLERPEYAAPMLREYTSLLHSFLVPKPGSDSADFNILKEDTRRVRA
jgi:hypothetical protein